MKATPLPPIDPRVRQLIADVIVPALLERFLAEHRAADRQSDDRIQQPSSCVGSAS